MNPTHSHQLTDQFYAWENRGRGWHLFDAPVALEPDFEPFYFHHVPNPYPVRDDGERHTVVSYVAENIRSLFGTKKLPTLDVAEDDMLPMAYPSSDNDIPLRSVSVSLPQDYDVRIEESAQLLAMLSLCRYPISFEIEASENKIRIQFVCREPDLVHVTSQLKAHFPGGISEDRTSSLGDIDTNGEAVCIADFGLSEEFMRPLKMTDSFKVDPFIGLFATLEQLGEHDHAIVQVLFTKTTNPWHDSILRSVSDNKGGAFFLNAPEMLPLAKEKISSPLYSVVIRVVGQSRTIQEAENICHQVAQSLIHTTASESNSLISLPDEIYSFEDRINDFLFRQSRRTGMLLNTNELLTVVHLPSASVTSEAFGRDMRKTKALPAIAEGHQLLLGVNSHQGRERAVSVSSVQRLKHMHILGATGTGKSTLLLFMIAQDVLHGNGLCVIDPHGDLIETVLSYIPEARMNDVVVIDPADADHPVGFNILSAHSDVEKEILSSDLVSAFRRLSTSWGDQMNSVLANAILAFLESTNGGTLADLRRFLIEKPFRDAYLKTVTDPSIIYYWQKEYPLLRSNSIGSILTRLDSFLRPKLIRNMVCQNKSIDFDALMDDRKIVLVKLSQGLIGEENSYLLGTFIVSKLHQAAMARQAKSERPDFLVYIDEFQNYVTPSMSAIVSGTRKYHLALVLAHQDMEQLKKHDTELTSAIIANAGTRICFRLGDSDAKKLADGFSHFDALDLQNLSLGEAIMRIDTPKNDFSLTTCPLPESPIPKEIKEQIIAHSRELYGTPRVEIEAIIRQTMEVTDAEKAEPMPEKPKPIPKKEPAAEKEVQTNVPKIPQPQPAATGSKEITHTPAAIEYIQKAEQRLHEELKRRIKRAAEEKQFKATLEMPTPDGKGFVDVSVERPNMKIAVEVSVTTGAAWELHNIQKCLAARYDTVIVCTNDPKNIEKIRALTLQHLSEVERANVRIYTPDQLFEHLDGIVLHDVPDTTVTYMKGRRVRVEYVPVSPEEAEAKSNTIKRILGKLP